MEREVEIYTNITKEIKQRVAEEVDIENIKKLLDIARIKKNELIDAMIEKRKEIEPLIDELQKIELYKSEIVSVIVDLSDVREQYDLEKVKKQLSSFVKNYITEDGIDVERIIRYVSYYVVPFLYIIFEDIKRYCNTDKVEMNKLQCNILLKYNHFDRAINIYVTIMYGNKIVFKNSRLYSIETEQIHEIVKTIIEKYQNILERLIKLYLEYETLNKIFEDLEQLTRLIVRFFI